MSIIEEVKGLNANSAVILAIFFVSFIAPAFLLIYRLNPDLFLALDTTKLILLSISVTSPSFLALYIGFEFWRVLIVAKGPNFKKSAINRE